MWRRMASGKEVMLEEEAPAASPRGGGAAGKIWRWPGGAIQPRWSKAA